MKINRRLLVEMFTLSGLGSLFSLPAKAGNPEDLRWTALAPRAPVSTFAELNEWLKSLPNEQFFDERTAICRRTGKEHRELFVSQLARPDDVKTAEREAVYRMQNLICAELAVRSFKPVPYSPRPIYWRIPLEWEVQDRPQVVEYREDGPDMDFMTNQRCVMDHNWKAVKAYCRFSVGEAAANKVANETNI